MLPGVHVTFPIPTDIENAYVQSYKLSEPIGTTIRSALDKFPNDFVAFKNYVQNTILPSAPSKDQPLIRELSGNQPARPKISLLTDQMARHYSRMPTRVAYQILKYTSKSLESIPIRENNVSYNTIAMEIPIISTQSLA